MLEWYRKRVVPRLLNAEMGASELLDTRREVVQGASGVVLEIGAGPGYNFALYGNVSKLYALEPSQELIDIATERVRARTFPVEFLRTGAENIPLPDDSVDTVVSTWTLCSVADLRKALSEVARVLRTGGRFAFADHGASPHAGIHFAQRFFTPLTKHFTGNCHYDRDIERALREAGFDIKEMCHPHDERSPLVYNYQGVATHG